VADGSGTGPRERLGRELRNRRILAGLSGPDLAKLIDISQSKISRTETARFRPNLEVVRRWLDATNTEPADRERIVALAHEAATEIAEYRTIFRGTLVNAQRALIVQDAVAKRIRHFQPFMIPGPLQTERYARVALLVHRYHDEAGLEEAVAARMERGQRLTRSDAPIYHVIMTELALRHRPWGLTDEDQLAAWRKILDLGSAPAVVVQVIPTNAPLRQAPMCAFVFTQFRDPADHDIVQVELPAVEMTFSGTADVEAFEKTWNAMAEAALDPKATSHLLTRMLRS
jgi:transcriptional regulator with XRE-family HTH domain